MLAGQTSAEEPSGIFQATEVGFEHDDSSSLQRSTSGQTNAPWARQMIHEIQVVMDRRQVLPNAVNVEAVTEAVLKAAPFVVGRASGRLFWRHQLTSQEFMDLLTDGYWWFVAFDVQRVHQRSTAEASVTNSTGESPNDPIFARMADSFVGMFQRVASSKKDLFFAHFFEAMACGVLNCLIQAHPKERAKFDTDEFRRRLLDRCSVWTTGMRPHSVPTDHWLLRASIQAGNQWMPPVGQQNAQSKLLLGGGSKQAQRKDFPEIHTVRCRHTLTVSPFLEQWMTARQLHCPLKLGLKVRMTQDRQRPVLFKPRLLTFGEIGNLPTGTPLRDADEGQWSHFISAQNRRVKRTDKDKGTGRVLNRSLSCAAELMRDHAQSRAVAMREVNEGHRAMRASQRSLDEEAKRTLFREDLREYTTYLIQGKKEQHKKQLSEIRR